MHSRVGGAAARREQVRHPLRWPSAPAAAAALPDADGVVRAQRHGAGHALAIPLTLLATDGVAFTLAVLLTAVFSPKTVTLLLLILVLFQAGDLYRRRLSLSVLDDVPSLMGRALAAGAVAMVVGGVDDGVAGVARVQTAAVFGVLALTGRAVAYAAIRAVRRRGRLMQRTLLLGAGSVAGNLGSNLLAHPEYGLVPKGMLDDDPRLRRDECPVPVLGGHDRLTAVILGRAIDVVVVTFGSLREHEVVPLLRTCDRLSCEIYLVPRLYELQAVARGTEVLWGVPLVRLRREPFRTGAWTGKRLSDLVLAAVGLVAVAPVLALCALACWLETGRVLFRQTRIGLDGRPFTLLKFCSLRPDCEAESTTRWTIAEDERVRPVGRLLRRTSLDELPQLWNILRGDMSLVGPRPERPYYVEEFSRQFPWYRTRHRVPVGLTGWAQIHGLRGNTSIAERARFDNFYIENWSLWGDVKIMLRTLGQVLTAAGR